LAGNPLQLFGDGLAGWLCRICLGTGNTAFGWHGAVGDPISYADLFSSKIPHRHSLNDTSVWLLFQYLSRDQKAT
jgi:hypothetical protein